VSSENPNHPRSSEQDHITEALRYYNSLYNKLHQSKCAEVLHNISLQTICSKLTNLKFSCYNHNSGVALVTLLQTTETDCSAQHTTRHRLPQRRSCSRVRNKPAHEAYLQQGFNKPWVQKYSTRLNQRKGWRRLRNAGSGESRPFARPKQRCGFSMLDQELLQCNTLQKLIYKSILPLELSKLVLEIHRRS
jgi:hypothetical protein